jgi:hypothetical protein
MQKFDAKKKSAILADYRADKLTNPEICAKHGVSKNVPRALAIEAGLPSRKTRPVKVPKVRPKKPQGLIKPPKVSREEWQAACVKRARYLATVGPYPERVLHPERYGGTKLPALKEGEKISVRRLRRHGVVVSGIMSARERTDFVS